MVGVPGKFKGCETCRLRRVKCDNTRPLCKKCHDTGRECAGYERETVFIIGTPQDGGRCSSHPPRVIKSKKATTGPGGPVPIKSGNRSSSSTYSVGSNNSSSFRSGVKSRSSPVSRTNSRSVSLSTSTSPGSTLSPSPSTPISIRNQPQRHLPPPSGATSPLNIMSSAKFKSSAVPMMPVMLTQSQELNSFKTFGAPELVPIPPPKTAWHDSVSVASGGIVYEVQLVALSTQLQTIIRQRDSAGGDGSFVLSPFSVYTTSGVRTDRHNDFHLSAQCMISLASDRGHINYGAAPGICLFLYEHNLPLLTGLLPPWKDLALQGSKISQMNPACFATFPAHHFFARIYRPNAIWAALIFRKGTFLSGPEWTSMPWEVHPKSGFDRLLDIAALLPVMLGRADNIATHEPTMARRMMAQEILANCIYVERVLEQWHASLLDMGMRGGASVGGASAMGSAPANVDGGAGRFQSGDQRASVSSYNGSGNWYWMADREHMSAAAQIPFVEIYAFRDPASALMFIYYWSILILLYPCIEGLHATIFQPVIDTHPSPYPNLPGSLQIPGGDPSVYYGPKHVRELAGNVCRALDFTLATTAQPDLLAAPLFVVELFYRQINAASGIGTLELLWCEAFRSRLAAKGQYLAEAVQSRRWVDAGQF